jgi:hypothetical protein
MFALLHFAEMGLSLRILLLLKHIPPAIDTAASKGVLIEPVRVFTYIYPFTNNVLFYTFTFSE